MVRTLILTVDRDNDLGVKAGIRGPVVGRKATGGCLRLELRTLRSLMNAILGALHQHDRLAGEVIQGR